MSLRSAVLATTLACVLAPILQAAEPARSTVRLVAAQEPIESSIEDEPLPTPISPRIPSPVVRPPTPSPNLGAELAAPAPNLYDPPTDAPFAPAPDGPLPYEHAPMHPESWEQPPGPRKALRDYLHHRPRQAPLERESWLNRPFSAGFFLGGLFLDAPVNDLHGDPGFMFGGRLGWDPAVNWGLETRMALAYPGTTDPTGQTDPRAAHVFIWDVNWLWYFTGDTRWRPYFNVGLGMFDIDYVSPTGPQHNNSFSIPFGVGFKYRHSSRLIMRVDLTDHYTFATGAQNTMHNLSLTAGLEARFGGGSRRNYWPWNPGSDWR